MGSVSVTMTVMTATYAVKDVPNVTELGRIKLMNDEILMLMRDINRNNKKPIIQLGNTMRPMERVPFTSPKMNFLTRGGMPRGRMVEFAGAEGSGKTTTALDLVAQAQKQGINCFYVDAENTLDEVWATKLGVDVENLLVIKPTHNESAETILDIVIALVDSGQFGYGVIDSVPFLVPKAVLEGSMEDKSYCGNAGAMTTFVNKIISRLAQHNTLLVMINQFRDKIGSTYVAYNTPGGRALKHAYSFRLFFNKGRFIDVNCKEQTNACEYPAGNIVEVKIEKNKVCRPDRRLGNYTLKYEDGIDIYNDTVDVAILMGLMNQQGAWYHIHDTTTGTTKKDSNGKDLKYNGKAKLLEALGADDTLFTELYDVTCAAAVA